MDYDRNDALLHWLFRQTQGDAWFRPNEENISSGVALRVSDGTGIPEYRVFPYENASLEPFETAVCALNPVVAVKVRSAAVHAALAEVSPEDKSIYVDANTRIQILETILLLPQAEKEQCAAFIRDERVLVIWSDSLDRIVPMCNDFEERLIKLLWRSRPGIAGTVTATSTAASVNDGASSENGVLRPQASGSLVGRGLFGEHGREYDDPDTEKEKLGMEGRKAHNVKVRRKWYGKKVEVITEEDPEMQVNVRKTKLYAPIYNGLAAGLAFVFIGNGISTLLVEWSLDGSFIRFALLAIAPLLYCVSLFFALQIVQNITMAVGPIAHFHDNSKYYSAIPPRPNKEVDNNLPHITIQMPVYKESLDAVLAPSIASLKKAMQTYARQGGTSTIFINDDGMRLLPAPDRDERLAFYANHNIGWVARPKHDSAPGGFNRAGRFKKASNMNYGLTLSLKAEKHLENLLANARANNPGRSSLSGTSHSHGNSGPTQYGMQYQNREGDESVVWGTADANIANGAAAMGYASEEDLEEKALALAIEEMWEESGKKFRPWAANGRATRIGEIVLIVDSDTVVPEDCLRDAAREMAESPTVAIIQHESDVMQVAHHYFENGIAYFTRRINRCISISCANGEVAPFMGHNAFLRWKAIQDAAFVDPADGQVKIWSESNVSEDFDIALRLMLKGYIIRWATYSKGSFKEGVSLSVDDELNRWQKYAYGCNELLFNPIVQWLRKGPIAHQIHRFLWSSAPMHYKISMMAYGIAGGITISIINYVLLGFQFPVDGYFMHSFEIWLATSVVFWGSGTIGYTLLEYRLGTKSLLGAFLENLMWIPFFHPLTQALLAHLFSYNIQWSATVKEVQRSNFFKEIPKICKRFWFPLLVSLVLVAGMIIISTPLVPLEWRVDGTAWAVIFPLALNAGCHILFPIVLNPWLMVFSY
ncbi:glycosyl transferase family group 2-domain-containing protein [Cyathus striatus]|nr:glycosyl transferase family group 2-domain-containing protein [Cyathus striatus]